MDYCVKSTKKCNAGRMNVILRSTFIFFMGQFFSVRGQNVTILDSTHKPNSNESGLVPSAVKPKINFDVPNFLMPNLGRRSRFLSFDSNSGDLAVNLELEVPFLTLPSEEKRAKNGMLMPLLNVNIKALIVFGALMAISAFVIPLFANKSPQVLPVSEPEDLHNYYNPHHNNHHGNQHNNHHGNQHNNHHNHWSKEHKITEFFKSLFETISEIGLQDIRILMHFFHWMLHSHNHEHEHGRNRDINLNVWNIEESLNEILLQDKSMSPCLQRIVCSAVALSRHHNKSTNIDKVVDFIKGNQLFDMAISSTLINDAVEKGHEAAGLKECFSFYKGCVINRRILAHILKMMGF